MKLIKNVTILLLIIATLFSAVSCKGKNQGPTRRECTVTVKNPLGLPLSGVTVYLHLDNGSDYNICTEPLTTDSNGKVTFTVDTGYDYSVELYGYPKAYLAKSGFSRAERYALDSDSLEIILGLSDKTPERYAVGDFASDFTVTDIDGVSYNLYDLLAQKRAVFLNFWYCGCGPCRSEFPALNAAYNTYKDSVELLAVNDNFGAGESEDAVREFGQTYGLDMPLFKTQYGSSVSVSRFGTGAYPTTVVIDRYGRISMLHVGAITSEAEWNAIFEYYLSDTYNGIPYN